MKILFLEANAITVELNNEFIYCLEKEYDIYLNDKYYKTLNTNVFSIYDLKPNTNYKIKVNNDILEFKTLNKKMVYYKKKNETDDTASINEAISNLKSDEILVLNEEYKITSLEIYGNDKSIYFTKNALLLGEVDRLKYKIFKPTEKMNGIVLGTWEGRADIAFYSTINILGATNINLYGQGCVNSNANNSDFWINHRELRVARRPKGVFIHTSKNVYIEGLTIKNTASWNIHPFYSMNLNFLNLKLINPYNSPTTDGCDPEACKNVNIIGNYISVGDDCIAIKSSKIELANIYHQASSNIVIRNNYMAMGHAGVTIGSENSGGVNNVYVSKCYFNGTDRGLRIKSQRGRGNEAIIKDIKFDNIYMDSVKSPFVINAYYKAGNDILDSRFEEESHPFDKTTPVFGNFEFDNIKYMALKNFLNLLILFHTIYLIYDNFHYHQNKPNNLLF